jgi:predicted nucleic acid-binding protein
MTLILDAGGVTALAGKRARMGELRVEGLWPPQIPAVVVVEVLTGDHRRDFHVNHLLRLSDIRDVDEKVARRAARLRTATGRADEISATDAVVAAFADTCDSPIVWTTDLVDLRDLAALCEQEVVVFHPSSKKEHL